MLTRSAFPFLAMISALLLVGCASVPTPKRAATIDHIVIGVAELASAIDDFERQTGVRPEIGGEHPGRGTHNALVSLGGSTYLELIAAIPGADAPDYEALRYLPKPIPILWAVGVEDVAAATSRLQTAGFTATAPEPGSRKTPAGALLEWETFGLESRIDAAPFFIHWLAGTPHPSTTSPTGCKLARFEITLPDPTSLERLRQALDLDVSLRPGEQTALAVTLSCPKGEVRLSP